MINMSAKEFDKRFDNGEDIDTLMKNPETLTITDLENIIKDKKHQERKYSITLDLNSVLIEKLKENANNLNVKIDDLIKIILADRLGVLH